MGAIGAAVLSTVGVWNLIVNHRRANAAEKQQAQELFVNSIRNLGDEEEIIRIGAIHGLRQLAKDSPENWRDKVAEILCARFRTITSADYFKKYGIKSFDESQVILEKLVQIEDNPFKSSRL